MRRNTRKRVGAMPQAEEKQKPSGGCEGRAGAGARSGVSGGLRQLQEKGRECSEALAPA